MTQSEHNDYLQLSGAERALLDKVPEAASESRLQASLDKLDHTPAEHVLQRAQLSVEVAGLLLDMDRKIDARGYARQAVEPLLAHGAFEDAVLACQFVYLADQDDSIPAIGQAAWLAVTYPIDPNLTANVLDHIIDETPDDADGAAVAAATAHYVVDLRGDDNNIEDLRMFTGAMLARVARRHSNVESQTHFELWAERLELDQPEKFLIRMRNVIDVLVQDDWWFDRDKLRDEISDDDE